MRTLAVVSGASRHEVGRTPGRAGAFLRVLAGLGPVDLVVIHDDAVPVDDRRAWRTSALGLAPPRPDDAGSPRPDRVVEVATEPPKRSGMLREVHLHRSRGPELAARGSAWFLVVDSFVASAPEAPALVWCADLASLTRAGWIRGEVPAMVDVDRFEDLGSERARRAARRTASVAHLVTVDARARRDQLGLPASIVAAPDEPELPAAIADIAERAATYRPARTS